MSSRDRALLPTVLRNTMVLAVGQILEKILNFLLILLLLRLLSTAAFGRYGFVSAYVLLFNVLVGLGFASICTREIARNPNHAPRILTSALAPMGISSIISFLIISATIAVTKTDQPVLGVAIRLAAGGMITDNFTAILATVPRARERMTFVALPKLIKSVVLLALCASFLRPDARSLVFIYSFVLAANAVQFVLQAYFLFVVFRVVPSRKFEGRRCLGMMRDAYPLALTSVFVAIYYKIDTVMLSYMQGDNAVGFYAAASQLASAPLFVAIAFHQSTLPTLAKLFASGRDRMAGFYRLSMKYLVICGLPVALGLMAVAPRIILLVCSTNEHEYVLHSTLPLQVLTLAVLLMFINGFMGNTLIASDGQRALMWIVALGAALNVSVNLIVIPRYGVNGAAATTVLAEASACVCSWVVLAKKQLLAAVVADFLRPVVCCAAMVLFVLACYSWSLPLLVGGGAFIYVALLIVSGSITRGELQLMRNMLRRTVG